MAGILQSYEVIKPIDQIQPFLHYKGKPSEHGYSIRPDDIIRLNYLDVNNNLINSDVSNFINQLILRERSFVTLESTKDVPISINITKSPKAPMSYDISYLFPQGDPYDYISILPLQEKFIAPSYDPIGILSWNCSISIEYTYFGRNGLVDGYTFNMASININANCDFEIDNPSEEESVLLEGLDLDINQHTLQHQFKITEDTNLKPVYQYSWTFGVN